MSSLADDYVAFTERFVNEVVEKNQRLYYWTAKLCHDKYGRGAMIFIIEGEYVYLEYATWEQLEETGLLAKMYWLKPIRTYNYLLILPEVAVCTIAAVVSDVLCHTFFYLGDFGIEEELPTLVRDKTFRIMKEHKEWKPSSVIDVGERKP